MMAADDHWGPVRLRFESTENASIFGKPVTRLSSFLHMAVREVLREEKVALVRHQQQRQHEALQPRPRTIGMPKSLGIVILS